MYKNGSANRTPKREELLAVVCGIARECQHVTDYSIVTAWRHKMIVGERLQPRDLCLSQRCHRRAVQGIDVEDRRKVAARKSADASRHPCATPPIASITRSSKVFHGRGSNAIAP
jgi:hypothetical protein